MEDKNNPLDSLASEFEFDSVDGDKNVGNSSTVSLEELNTLTGRDYKDKETALKSLKETYSMVGKAGKIAKDNKLMEEKLQNNDSALSEIKLIKEELFYSQNPEFKPYRDTIAAMGTNPADVVEKESFKKIFTDLTEYEKTKNAKSVLESNPRIGQAKTKIDEARDMVSRGQYAESKATAVDAVLQAYDS